MRTRARARRAWRATKIAGVVMFCMLVGPVLVALVGVAVECRVWAGSPPRPDVAATPPKISRITAGLSDYARPEDQTYLTLPEWYIVYSADEYATFVAENPPSGFPYFRAIGQFWGSYYNVCGITREQYAFNSDYHLILTVIGTSFTIENVLRGIYENTFGRGTEWLSDGGQTEEDAYARVVAEDYGTFLHTTPWYEFPFGEKLRGVWSKTGAWGPNIVRKWERKLALSAEYGGKAAYAWLIKQGTQSVFSAADLTIQVLATGITEEVVQREAEVRIVQEVDGPAAFAALPRYEAFTQIVPRLAGQGVELVEIAGNDEILLTLIGPRGWSYDLQDGELLFEMPILTQPERKRVAVNVPVAALHQVLDELERGEAELEHIYDY